MTEMATSEKKGFLGLTASEWSRALSTGGLSLVFERETSSSGPEEPTSAEQVMKAKDLGRVALVARAELDALPRDILIKAAWQGVAHYHVEGTTWGFEAEHVKAFEAEKDFRLSILDADERERAVALANDWLDDNFSE